MSFSDSLIHELEKSRKNQSCFHNWCSQRKGCITASRFHEFNQKVQTLYKNSLKPVKCRITPLLLRVVEPKELKNVESLEWGKKNEKNAAESFMKIEGKKHTNPKLLSYGLYLFKPHSYTGATPDNVVKVWMLPKIMYWVEMPWCNTKWKVNWVLAKMWFSRAGKWQNTTLFKHNHRYYSQAIGQMTITGHHNTYVVVFTSQDVLLDCVRFDESYWQKILPNLIVFFKTYIEKYLLGITQIFIRPMCEKPCLNSNEFETDEENSIQCERCSVWIHWGCSGITKEIDASEDFVCLLCQ